MNEFENRVIELLTFLHEDAREMKKDLREVKADLKGFKEETRNNFNDVRGELFKVNANFQVLNRDVLKLAEVAEKTFEHEKRITRLEMLVEGAK